MIEHQSLVKWEERLKRAFDRIDDCLEERYGSLYPLHPQRAERGLTSNREHDGLFNVGASYSLGMGSKYGKGYVIEVHMATLTGVPDDVKNKIEKEAASLLGEELKKAFPQRDLSVVKDGDVYKITGDFSLGKL